MRHHRSSIRVLFSLAVGALGVSLALVHAAPQSAPPATPGGSAAPSSPTGPVVVPPPDFVIGAEDVLTITFWRDKEMSGDVAVRPDGKITIGLINDVQAAGLTPEQLRMNLIELRKKYEEDPTVGVSVRTINSRKVYITGAVGKPGAYPLNEPLTVLQLISKSGGLADYADRKNIVVIRVDAKDGKQTLIKVNYDDMWDPKKLKQNNIDLKPGDTVIVK